MFRDAVLLLQESFTTVWLMTQGGPYYATYTLPQFIGEQGFGLLSFGTASAALWVLVSVDGCSCRSYCIWWHANGALVLRMVCCYDKLAAHAVAGDCRHGLLLPLVWMTATAFHAPATPLPTSLRLVPDNPTVANFGRIFTIIPLLRFTINSLIVVALAVPLTLLTGSWAGFGMAQLPERSQRRWVIISLIVLIIPGIALWSTRFLLWQMVGLDRHVLGDYRTSLDGYDAVFVLMFYRAFRRVPAGLYDAARLDGAGVLRTWASVAFRAAGTLNNRRRRHPVVCPLLGRLHQSVTLSEQRKQLHAANCIAVFTANESIRLAVVDGWCGMGHSGAGWVVRDCAGILESFHKQHKRNSEANMKRLVVLIFLLVGFGAACADSQSAENGLFHGIWRPGRT